MAKPRLSRSAGSRSRTRAGPWLYAHEWRNSGGGLAVFEAVSLGAADLGRAFLRVGVVALPGQPGATQATAKIDIWRACDRLKPPQRSERTAARTAPERFACEPIEIRTPRQFAGGEHEHASESHNRVTPGRPAMFDAGDGFAGDVCTLGQLRLSKTGVRPPAGEVRGW
jgi:hypothetical protein